jgi:ATP-dependent DNA ligase
MEKWLRLMTAAVRTSTFFRISGLKHLGFITTFSIYCPGMERRALLKSVRDKRTRIADYFEAAPTDLLSAVREQRLEGVIGKRKDSVYQPGKRSGAWTKCRVNRGQEFVIGGYFPGPHGFDSLIVGFYDGGKLIYVARTRNGFVPPSRRQVFSKLKHLVTASCPF